MADEVMAPVVTTPAAPQSTVTPIKGSPEYNAAMASLAPANVPDKFKNSDGTVNLPALTQAYRELETKQGQAKAPETPATPPAANAPTLDIDAALAKPDPATANGWQTAQQEIETDGKISDATRAMLKTKYSADDTVLDGMVTGHKAKQVVMTQKLADAVGGTETLKNVLNHAARTMAEADLAQLRAALKTPMGPMVLRGIAAGMPANTTPAQSTTPKADGLLGIVAGGTAAGAQFKSVGEMMAAMRDARYQYDPDYRDSVAKRIPVGFGR